MRCAALLATTFLVALASACGGAAPPNASSPAPSGAAASSSVSVPPAIKAVVDASDRSDDDRALDAGRKPGEMLAFFGVQPGMKVAELAAGTGYTSELLARAVGGTGVVYAQNSKWILERFAEKPWSDRMQKGVMKNVVRVDRDFEAPLPPEAKGLDVVFDVLFYHDTFWLKVDRAKMNKAVFDALKPGGVYAIIDHSGRPGTGSSEVQTLHRIEESVVKDEIVAAGFRLAGEGAFLRNPSDARDWNDSPKQAADRRGTSDRFVYKFVKP